MMKTSGDPGVAHGHVTSQVNTGGAHRVPVAPPHATADGPPLARNLSLGLFLLLFVASHLLYLVLMDPGHLVLYSAEEPYRGAIAQELLTGLAMPFADYRADNYSGGSLVIGALAAGFFLLFGPTLFSLKLAPLLIFTLALVFWYWTIQRAAGERVAGCFALLFCFSPPLFTDFSMMAMGFHSESIVFSAVTGFLFFRMLSEETPSPAYPALLGLTAGFGLWFAYIYGLTLLTMLVFWLWHNTGMFRRPRLLWFTLGFLVGFSPWILINVQTHFAGLMVGRFNLWEHFGFEHLLDGLAQPWELAPVEFLRSIASDDDWDLYRRAVNLLYSLLYLGPLLIAGVLRLKTERSTLAGARATRLPFVGFASLYIVVFALAVQFSDFRDPRYYLPIYPFLFFLVALAVARCQDAFPVIQKKIQTVFLTSAILLSIGTHAPLLSLDRPGAALSAKGYSYAWMPLAYWGTHTPAGPADRGLFPLVENRGFFLEIVQRPFLSAILPKLSSDDQQELSLAIVSMLAFVAPLNGQDEDSARLERLVPPGFDTHFHYQLGVTAMIRHSDELPRAVAAVEFLRHRSAASHHLALVGIYRRWPKAAPLDASPELLANLPAAVAPALSPHYWRALGHLAGRYWYERDRSLSRLNAHLQVFVPRLDPSVQRSFLQGIGELLFERLTNTTWVSPAELERFPQAYQEGLWEGWGMELGAHPFSGILVQGHRGLVWMASTKELSARSLSYVQRGKAQFDALFEGPAPSAREPSRQAP